jgi:hypothetical protein
MSATDGILFRRLAYARDQDTLQDVKRYCKKEREVITDTEEFGGCLNLLHEDLRSVSRSVIEVGKIVVASISRSYRGYSGYLGLHGISPLIEKLDSARKLPLALRNCQVLLHFRVLKTSISQSY